jgi:hypothetical protein
MAPGSGFIFYHPYIGECFCSFHQFRGEYFLRHLSVEKESIILADSTLADYGELSFFHCSINPFA